MTNKLTDFPLKCSIVFSTVCHNLVKKDITHLEGFFDNILKQDRFAKLTAIYHREQIE